MYVVRIRGLPYSAESKAILEFFKDVKVANDENGIRMTQKSGGRPSGEAYVELVDEENFNKALDLHKKNMGHRYIEVFRSDEREMNDAMAKSKDSQPRDASQMVLRLRGLPFETVPRDVHEFLRGIETARNGINIIFDFEGKCTGEAYICFNSLDMFEKAKSKHMDKIGHRYIEIFQSDFDEMDKAMRRFEQPGWHGPGYDDGVMNPYGNAYPPAYRYGGGGDYGPPMDPYYSGYDDYGPPPPPPPQYYGGGPMRRRQGQESRYGPPPPQRGGPYARPPMPPGRMPMREMDGAGPYGPPPGGPGYGGASTPGVKQPSTTGHTIHMRGLPFSANEREIFNFFRPLQPVSVRLLTLSSGRASGEADVDFDTHDDAMEAMKKDREVMDQRYIELFLESKPSSGIQPLMMTNVMPTVQKPLPNDAFNRLPSQTGPYGNMNSAGAAGPGQKKEPSYPQKEAPAPPPLMGYGATNQPAKKEVGPPDLMSGPSQRGYGSGHQMPPDPYSQTPYGYAHAGPMTSGGMQGGYPSMPAPGKEMAQPAQYGSYGSSTGGYW